MLRFLPFDRPHLPSKGTPVLPSFREDPKLEPQTVGIGLITVLMAGLTLYVSRLNLVQSHGLAPTLETIAQPLPTTTIASKHQRPEDCQPHEVFRVSDRRCYQVQGE